MKRDIEKDLLDWKDSALRKPLLVRGSRQIGKSYTITKFARENFDNFVVVNFDKTPEVHKFFSSDFNPSRIIQELSVYYDTDIVCGKSIVFFDEIQECPRAIMSLRYFYEEMPKLHVIGAGSLLEFILRASDFKMPVGRIDYLWMKPVSFGEFLDAMGHDKIRQEIQHLTVKDPPSEPIHQKILSIFKEYLYVGGMPAAAAAYADGMTLKQIKELQESLLRTFRDDFGKYASHAQYKYLDKVFLTAPKMAGKNFKYSQVDRSFQIRDIKNALDLLTEAGLFYKIKHAGGRGLPLEADTSEKKFKMIFFDIGLMQRLLGLDSEICLSEDVTTIHQGSVAEQVVGQELLAYAGRKVEEKLYFWMREERGSSAEVDYLLPVGAHIYPIEVKSGSAGRLKSLRLFMKERSSLIGVRISARPFSFYDGILSVPIYAVERLKSLIEDQK